MVLQSRQLEQDKKGKMKKLTDRQREIVRLISYGSTDKEIASEISVSCETVSYHVGRIMKKLKAKSRAHAVAIFIRSSKK